MQKLLRRILRGIWNLVKIYFFIIGVAVFTLFVAVSMIFSFSSQKGLDFLLTSKKNDTPKTLAPKEDNMVVVDLEGSVYEQVIPSVKKKDSTSSLQKLFRKNRTYISTDELNNQIEHLKNHKHIKGVLFNITPTFSVPIQYLNDILPAFTSLEEKKPIYFFANRYDKSTYALAKTSKYIAIAPASEISFNAGSLWIPHLYNVLQHFGIKLEIFRAGKWKGYTSGFDANIPDYAADHLNSYINSSLDYAVNTLHNIKNLSKSKEEIRGWFEKEEISSYQAIKEGLVWGVFVLDEWKEQLLAKSSLSFIDYHKYSWSHETSTPSKTSKKLKVASEESNGWQEWLQKDTKESTTKEPAIGFLSYRGTISLFNNSSYSNQFSYKRVKKDVEWMLEQDHIKAVILEINSPGGGFYDSEVLWQELKRLNDQKPIVTYVTNMAASGGYYLASATSYLIARPMAVIGSIGVISIRPNTKEISQKYGLSVSYFGPSSAMANLLDFNSDLQPATLERVNDTLQTAYQHFLRRVADFRGMETDKVDKNLAGGRLWTGVQAKEIGLVDEIGDISTAFIAAARLGKMGKMKRFSIIRPNKPSALQECLKDPYACLMAFRSAESSSSFILNILSSRYLQNNVDAFSLHSMDTYLKQLLKNPQSARDIQALLWLHFQR